MLYTPRRRGMAGGFPANMKVKKNISLEEWNGKREITEQTFEMNFQGAPIFLITLVFVPGFTYFATRTELLRKDDTRFFNDIL